MSKAEYILRGQYGSGGLTSRSRWGGPARIDQIFGAPVIGLPAPAQVPILIGFVCVRPEDLPFLRGIENVATSENRMHDELPAVRQSINPALS